MKKWFMMPLFLLLAILPAAAQKTGIDFIEDKKWQELLALSSKENKLIFLDCYTTWCGPCKAMAKDVFPLPEVGNFMNARFINTKIDMEKGEGIELNKKYKKFIPGYPTYLLINGQGEVVHQVAGYNPADKFIAKINDGLNEKSWVALGAKFDKGERDWELVWTYLTTLEDAFQKTKVTEVVKQVLPKLNVDEISNNPNAYKVFRKYWDDAEAPLFYSLISSPGIYRKHKDPEKEVNEWAGRIFKKAVDSYVKKSIDSAASFDKVKSDKLLEKLIKSSVPNRENLVALILISQSVSSGNANEFIRLAESAKEFGLLRYDSRSIASWSKLMAEQTSDKEKLQAYLKIARLKEEDKFISVEEIKAYAFILDKMGDKEQAAIYHQKAAATEAELKEKYNSFINSSK